MDTLRRSAWESAWKVVGVVCLLAFGGSGQAGLGGMGSLMAEQLPRIPLAVLGDSDSESYARQRGGAFAAQTLQWTEVLGQLRSRQLDLGAWGSWGQFARWMRWQRALGWPLRTRAPRKYDFEYNFAIGGAGCEDLMSGLRQAPFLADLIASDPARWARGLVVIRIGGNSFGKADSLDQLAHDPLAPAVQQRIDFCLAQIRQAISTLRESQPRLRFVLVGVYDNTLWPDYFDRWRDPDAVDNIQRCAGAAGGRDAPLAAGAAGGGGRRAAAAGRPRLPTPARRRLAAAAAVSAQPHAGAPRPRILRMHDMRPMHGVCSCVSVGAVQVLRLGLAVLFMHSVMHMPTLRIAMLLTGYFVGRAAIGMRLHRTLTQWLDRAIA